MVNNLNPTAKKMLSVIKDIYGDSMTAMALFQAMGAEWGEAENWVESLKEQMFPQTVTWAIAYWENRFQIKPNGNLSLAYRRSRLMAKMMSFFPLNPYRMEKIAAGAADNNIQAAVTEHVAPYTFRLELTRQPGNGFAGVDFTRVLENVLTAKPSHLSLEYLQIRQQGTGRVFLFHAGRRAKYCSINYHRANSTATGRFYLGQLGVTTRRTGIRRGSWLLPQQQTVYWGFYANRRKRTCIRRMQQP